MKLSKSGRQTFTTSRALLTRLIETPDLARTVQALPGQAFAEMVRTIGVEDAGELLALATTEQIVQAFDESLFVNERAGEREVFDAERFATWLEVMLEAGDAAAARRFAELDEDFVAHALAGMVLVLDEDLLREHTEGWDEHSIRRVDKALESALTEDLDGYLLVSKRHDGWDAALALILALDRDDRSLLERLLERLAAVTHDYLDDPDELSEVLSEGESLSEDVEAAREQRRSAQGYVEPRAARAFLELARRPPSADASAGKDRDPLTRAYFRDLEARPQRPEQPRGRAAASGGRARPGQREQAAATPDPLAALAPAGGALAETIDPTRPLREALAQLREVDPEAFDARVEELVYLANVVVAGVEHKGRRMRPGKAAEAVFATLCLGAAIELGLGTGAPAQAPTAASLVSLLREQPMDVLFRQASGMLAAEAAAGTSQASTSGLLYSAEELTATLARLASR